MFPVSCMLLRNSEKCVVNLGESFTKKPEELLQPQNKAKQHSFKVVPSMCGKRLTLDTLLAVICFYFQNPQNLLHIHVSAF